MKRVWAYYRKVRFANDIRPWKIQRLAETYSRSTHAPDILSLLLLLVMIRNNEMHIRTKTNGKNYGDKKATVEKLVQGKVV